MQSLCLQSSKIRSADISVLFLVSSRRQTSPKNGLDIAVRNFHQKRIWGEVDRDVTQPHRGLIISGKSSMKHSKKIREPQWPSIWIKSSLVKYHWPISHLLSFIHILVQFIQCISQIDNLIVARLGHVVFSTCQPCRTGRPWCSSIYPWSFFGRIRSHSGAPFTVWFFS